MDNFTINVLQIVPGTSVDGPGLRTSVYFAGCRHQCPGCHNPQSWDFNAGQPMTLDEIMAVIEENDFNVTFTGGDPIYNIDLIIPLAERIRRAGYTLWVYTGYTFEQLLTVPGADRLLPYVDVIVDGPFIEAQRDISLRFRGSANQRIIDVAASLAASRTVLLPI